MPDVLLRIGFFVGGLAGTPFATGFSNLVLEQVFGTILLLIAP
jgi:hypothetical protein